MAVGSKTYMTVSSYKNWKKVLFLKQLFDSGVQAISFDQTGKKVFVAGCGSSEVKTLSIN